MFEFLNSLWFRIRSRSRRDKLDAELAEELRLHTELLQEDAIRAGASAHDAARQAAYRMGNLGNIQERTRRQWSFGLFEALLQDTRYAVRFLRRSPGFTTVAVLSLALGVGANATVFAVADRLMFRAPPHVVNSNALFQLNVRRNSDNPEDRPFMATTYFPEYFALLQDAKSFRSLVLYTSPTIRRLGRGPDALRIKESMASVNFFDVLGVRAIRGRFFLPSDDSSQGAELAAVISHGFWQRQFGGADSAIGARFNTSNLNFVVVGVAPREFTGIDIDAADVWVPLGAAAPTRIGATWKERSGYSPHLLARLRNGIALEGASVEVTTIINRIQDANRRGVERKTALFGSVIAAKGPAEQSGAVKVSTRLVVASVLVLLAACANLANLLLVRALTRKREIALRLAIGVSRARLAFQMLLESLLIACAGCAAALIAARWSGDALRSLVFPELQWASAAINIRVFAFAALCGTMVAIVATIVPAIRMTRADVGTALRSAAPQLSASTGRLRQSLLALQVALSVLLIVGATAFSRSLNAAHDFDMGVDVDRIMTGRYALESDSLGDASRLAVLEEAARRVRTIPGVERATVASAVPLTGNTMSRIRIPEQELPPNTYAVWWPVTPDLQRTVGFRLTRGRWITPEDVAPGMPPVVLASEKMARDLWPGTDAIGRCLRLGSDTAPCLQVVGVIHDLRKFSIREDADKSMLVSKAEPTIDDFAAGYVVIRINEGVKSTTLVTAIRNAMRNVRGDIRSIEVQPLAQTLDRDYRPLKLGTATFGSFAALATLLSAVGLYGILAFSVAQRTGEFGIRSALGARATHLVRNVVGEGMTVVAVGLLVGMVLSWYASTTIAALLFNSSARDAAPYIYAAILLSLVALVASAIPAWRATRIDPANALRAE